MLEVTAPNASALRNYSHIDQVLGPSESRFFGAGYKNSSYQIAQTRSVELARTFEGYVQLSIAPKWSTKGNGEQLPHVSTTDVLAIAMFLSESAIEEEFGIYRNQLLLNTMTVRAPARPAEGNRYEFQSRCTVEKVPENPDIINTVVSFLGFTVRSSFGQIATVRSETVSNAKSHWLDGFKQSSNQIENVVIDPNSRTSSADLVHGWNGGDAPLFGADTLFPDAPSIIDCFVSGLQLGQVLIYDIDEMDRSQSNTLWMRSLSITTNSKLRSTVDTKCMLRCDVKKTSILPCDDDTVWRTILLGISLPGITMDCSVVHNIKKRK